MHSHCSTKIEVNKAGVRFTGTKVTAYGGFSLLALFFQKVALRETLKAVMPVAERSPNAMGIYEKVLAYALMVYAGGSRFGEPYITACPSPCAPAPIGRQEKECRASS